MQINNDFQKNANISLITQLLWCSPGISRVEIARQLNLYRSTVSNITNYLIANGIVLEGKEGAGLPQGGRKPICLELNRKFGCVLGIEIKPSHYEAVLVDFAGGILHSESGVLPEQPFDTLVEYVVDCVMPVIDVGDTSLLAVCVGLQGAVDPVHGTIIRSDSFGLQQFALPGSLSAKYRVPVFVERDMHCLVWLDLANARSEDVKNFLCVNSENRKSAAGDDGMKTDIALSIGGSVWSSANQSLDGVNWQAGYRAADSSSGVSSNAFEAEVVNVFSGLIPVVSVLAPEVIFAHGEFAGRMGDVREILSRRVPLFQKCLEQTGSNILFGDGNANATATGAAMMYLSRLFSAPVSTPANAISIEWDSVLKTVSKQISAVVC